MVTSLIFNIRNKNLRLQYLHFFLLNNKNNIFSVKNYFIYTNINRFDVKTLQSKKKIWLKPISKTLSTLSLNQFTLY